MRQCYHAVAGQPTQNPHLSKPQSFAWAVVQSGRTPCRVGDSPASVARISDQRQLIALLLPKYFKVAMNAAAFICTKTFGRFSALCRAMGRSR